MLGVGFEPFNEPPCLDSFVITRYDMGSRHNVSSLGREILLCLVPEILTSEATINLVNIDNFSVKNEHVFVFLSLDKLYHLSIFRYTLGQIRG